MGGASRSSSYTTSQPVGFPLGDKAKREPVETLAERLGRVMDSRAANHSAHVEAYRKHQEWINRPWTWRNYLAAAINRIIGGA